MDKSPFVLKTDIFINMPNLLAFIDSHKNNKVMYGRLTKGWKPIRNIRSKYKIRLAAEDLQPKLPTTQTQM